MGLTIKGQCIPDVTESMEGVQAGGGLLQRGAGGVGVGVGGNCSGGDTLHCAEQEASGEAPQEAEGRPSRFRATGLWAQEDRSWF
jgi:hypothetical protein